jgi:hypothetical protein
MLLHMEPLVIEYNNQLHLVTSGLVINDTISSVYIY